MGYALSIIQPAAEAVRTLRRNPVLSPL
jgi:hypothetical protein